MTAPKGFFQAQRDQQTAFFEDTLADAARFGAYRYRLDAASKELNLAPSLRPSAAAYFEGHGVAWHRHANHALSSQVCCLNFLMPLAERPETLARLVQQAVGGSMPKMLRIEEPDRETGGYVGFEWIGKGNYLNEANAKGQRSRGANATAADAIVRFEQDGRTETLLIEWKYTESYGAGLATSATSTETRLNRYKDIAFAPEGPIRADLGLALGDFFYEPFYQLLRQQMLAHQMQKQREDGAERVRVLHIAPRANRKLRRITSPAIRQKIGGDDAFAVFRSMLTNPDEFISAATESLFAPLLKEPGEAAEWAEYLTSRYAFLSADGRA